MGRITIGPGPVAAPGAEGFESFQDHDQEKSHPDAFTLAFTAHPVHAVVPVPGAEKGKSMVANFQGTIDGPAAMFIQVRRLAGRFRVQEGLVLGGFEFSGREVRDHFPQNAMVPGGLDVIGRQQGKPQKIVREPGPDAPAVGGGCHQCSTSPSTNWWAA